MTTPKAKSKWTGELASARAGAPAIRALRAVVLSFDVEEHFRIEAAAGLPIGPALRDYYGGRVEPTTRWILDQLDSFGIKATFFVVGELARAHPALIRAMVAAGHEVASHGWNHQRLHNLTPDSFREDLRQSKDALEQIAGQAVLGYRAPTFSLVRQTAWAVDVLAEAGLLYDSSLYPVRHDRYGVPEAPRWPFRIKGPTHTLLEIPPATWRFLGANLPMGGGGYFRLLPLPLLQKAIEQARRDGEPAVAMLYFHPWEFDPRQARLPLGRLSRFRTYIGQPRSRARLRSLLSRYRFSRAIDVARRLDSKPLSCFDLNGNAPFSAMNGQSLLDTPLALLRRGVEVNKKLREYLAPSSDLPAAPDGERTAEAGSQASNSHRAVDCPNRKRKLNRRLVAALVIASAVLVAGVHFLHKFQLHSQAGAFLDQAMRAEERSDLDDAVTYLDYYLTCMPEDTGALVRYGRLLEKIADSRKGDAVAANDARLKALAAFEQALHGDPENAELRDHVIDTAMSLRRHALAIRHLELALASSPEDGKAAYLLGKCQEDDGQYVRAAQSYEKAIHHQPGLIEAFVRLADLLRQHPLDRPIHASDIMDRMVEANPQDYRAYLARSRYRQKLGLQRQASKDLARALALAPREPDVLLAAAELARKEGDLNQAREYLQQGLGFNPEHVAMLRALAGVDIESGRHDDAMTHLRQVASLAPQQTDGLLALAEGLIEKEELVEAAAVVAQLENRHYNPEWLDFLNARILIKKGQWTEAVRLLNRARPQLVRSPEVACRVDIALAHCHEQLGDIDRQLTFARRAVAMDPSSAAARLCLGKTLIALGWTDQAVTEFHNLVAQSRPPAGADLTLARLLIQKNRLLPTERRDWEEVDKLLDQIAKRQPDSVKVTVVRAQLLDARDQSDRAFALLDQARATHHDHLEIWESLALLAERQGNAPTGVRIMEGARNKFGDTLELRLAQARFWAQGQRDQAVAHLRELEDNLASFSSREQQQLLQAVAASYQRIGAIDETRRVLGELARANPNDLRLRLLLFDLEQQMGDEQAMRRLVKEIRRLEGEEGSLWRYAEAAYRSVQARRGDRTGIADARRRLAEIAGQRPTWSRVPLLEANLDELEGNTESALQHYLLAMDRGDRQPAVVGRVAQLMAERQSKKSD